MEFDLAGESTRNRATTSNTPQGEMDEILDSETDFAMGFMLHCPNVRHLLARQVSVTTALAVHVLSHQPSRETWLLPT